MLLFHCGVPGFGGGFVGVDVFFVISGYLITGHLAEDIAQGRMSILRFYASRVRRIAPALFVTLIVTWFTALVMFLPDYLLRTSNALMSAAASVSNVYFWKAATYFGNDSIFQPLLHTWSLSVEEQFYAVIPLGMLIAVRLRFRNWAVLFGLVCLGSFALSVYITDTGPGANFYLLPPRAWELGIGSFLATARLPALTQRWAIQLAGGVGLLLILVPVTVFDDATPFPGLNALYPCLGAALLIYVGRARGSPITALLSTAPFVGVGRISYSLYLVHWPLIVFMRYSTVEPLTAMGVVEVLVTSFVLAYLSWRFIETPFRRPRPFFTQWRILAGGAAGIVVAVLIGFVGVRAHGFPTRFPTFKAVAAPDAEWMPDRCFLVDDPNYRLWSAPDCTRVATGPGRVLLWGDSFAAQYVPGLLAHADALKATIIQYTAAGCVPVLSFRTYSRGRCREFNDYALQIIKDQKIDTVILTARWTEVPAPELDQIGSTLDALRKTGVRVIMLGQSPEFPEDVHVISYFKGDRNPDAVNRWRVFVQPAFNQKLAKIAGDIKFINPIAALCRDSICPYEDKGVFLYSDYGHMSVEGSHRAVDTLFVATNILHP